MPTFTAMYETRAEAEATQRKLEQLGIIDTDDRAIHDKSSAGFNSDSYSSHADRGLWAGTKGAFLPDEDRHTYEEGVRRGHYLLTVNVDDAKADEAHRILESSNAVNIDERANQWRQEGWSAPTTATTPGAATTGTAATSGYTAAGVADTARQTGEEHIPLMEEELRVGKREVARGGVRVRSYVVEQPVHEQVALREEHVSVERRPVDSTLGTANAAELGDAFRERTIDMTETAEEAVVDKRARVVEEVVVRKDVEERVENIDDTVRRTEVDVDRIADNDRLGTDRLAARDADLNRADRDDKLR